MFVDYGSSAATPPPRYPVAPLREREWDESRRGLRLSDFRAYIGVHQLVGTVDELMGGFGKLIDGPVGGVAFGEVFGAGAIDQPFD